MTDEYSGLSKRGRRKLKRLQRKELRRGEREQTNRSKLKTKITYSIIIIVILAGIGFFVVGGSPPTTGNIVFDSFQGDPVKGESDAPVTIVEFGHHECPFCARYHFNTEPLIEQNYINTGLVRYVFKMFPVASYTNSFKSSEAALCANEQGKFWEFNDLLFKNQRDLSVSSLKRYAVSLDLDAEQFNQCLDSGVMSEKLRSNIIEGQAAGVRGTPSFLINGQLVVGAQPYSVFKQIIDASLVETET